MKRIINLAGLMLAALAATTSLSCAAPVPDTVVINPDHPASHISAWGDNLSDMTSQLAIKANAAGASRYVITSAHVGNRTYGTAVIYR